MASSDKNHVNMYDDLSVRYASPTPLDDEEKQAEEAADDGANTSNRICQACRKKLDNSCSNHPRIWFPKYFCGYCHRKLQHKHSLWIHLFHHTAAMQRPPYTCPLCQKVFDTLSGYKLHLGSLHNVKPSNDCPFCPKKFMDRKLFDAHLLSHQGEDVSSSVKPGVQHLLEFHRSMVCNECFLRLQHMCNACREMFNRKEELRQHQMDVHFHCPVCNSCFVKKTSVLQHVRKCHEDLVSTSCDVCRGVLDDISIRSDDDGNADMYELPEKPAEKGKVYKCVTCNAYFWDDEGEMESTVSSCRVCVQQRKPKRQKTDVRERKFECGECSLKMTSLDEVSVHVRTHAKDPPPKEEPEDVARPQCNICLRLFLTDEALLRHVRLCHHHCVFCSMAFHEKSHLILHVMANHGEENPVVCQECKKLYVTVYQTDPNEPLRQAEGIQYIFRPVLSDEVNVDMEENNPNN